MIEGGAKRIADCLLLIVGAGPWSLDEMLRQKLQS